MRFDEAGPFVFLNRFRDDWIVSRQAVRLFLVSVPFILALTPFLFGWVNVSKMTIWQGIAVGVVGVMGPIASFFLWLGMKNGHAHRWRDTFAVELLLKRVPVADVAVLLGHQSVKITEKSYSPWVIARREQLEQTVRSTF
jgi:hypothetical protein